MDDMLEKRSDVARFPHLIEITDFREKQAMGKTPQIRKDFSSKEGYRFGSFIG